jgi:hypothetical protein
MISQKLTVLSGDAFVFGKVVESIIEGFFQDDVDSWIFGGHRKITFPLSAPLVLHRGNFLLGEKSKRRLEPALNVAF